MNGLKLQYNFLYFNTACGCVRMMIADPVWEPRPEVILPLVFPTEVRDWVQEEIQDDQISPFVSARRFRLEREDVLEDGKTKIFTYREMRN